MIIHLKLAIILKLFFILFINVKPVNKYSIQNILTYTGYKRNDQQPRQSVVGF